MKKYKVKGVEIEDGGVSPYGVDMEDELTKMLSEQLAKEIDRELVLGILAENKTEVIKEFKKFTNMDGNDIFIDIDTRANRMEENQAFKLWDELNKKENTLEDKLKRFKAETNLPLRKLAEITGINKDKINILTK